MGLVYRSRLLLGWEITFMILSGIVVILRLMAWQASSRRFRSHDIFCILALIFIIGYGTIWSVASYYGIGLHTWEISPHEKPIVLKLFYSSNFIYGSAVIFMRMSILFLYLALFPQRSFRYWAYGIGAFSSLLPFALVLYSFGICIPMSKAWEPETPGHCGSDLAVEVASAIGNGISDIALMLMPMPVVWSLRMSERKKTVVTGIFAVSIITLAINIARVVLPFTSNFDDFTFYSVPLAILTTAEIFSGILVACMPVMGPIFKYHKVARCGRPYHETWSTEAPPQSDVNSASSKLHRPSPLQAEMHHFGGSFNSIDFPEREEHGNGVSIAADRQHDNTPPAGRLSKQAPSDDLVDGSEADVVRSYSGSTEVPREEESYPTLSIKEDESSQIIESAKR